MKLLSPEVCGHYNPWEALFCGNSPLKGNHSSWTWLPMEEFKAVGVLNNLFNSWEPSLKGYPKTCCDEVRFNGNTESVGGKELSSKCVRFVIHQNSSKLANSKVLRHLNVEAKELWQPGRGEGQPFLVTFLS